MVPWMLRVVVVLPLVQAQLLVENRSTLEQLAKEAEEAHEEAQAAEGFTHPKLCDPSVNQTAGYISVNPITKYFFWLFEAKENPSSAPLVMWLSGGPGCSSQLALFAENWPCKVAKNGQYTYRNPASWHYAANVMWVDQPAGVGFSTGIGTHNEQGVANNMLVFLQKFFAEFPQYQSTNFYIFGESYAGHYVPAIGHRIWSGNKAGEGQKIPLKGLAIGNGLTDPLEQYKWYPEMAHFGGQKEGGHAPANVVSKGDYYIMKGLVPACELGIIACNRGVDPDPTSGGVVNATACFAAYDACNLMAIMPYELTGKNPYDMRSMCKYGRLCYDFDMIGTYLNKPDVQSELGVHKKWGSCNYAVDLSFVAAGDWLVQYQQLLPDLLADGIDVLIYAGDVDYICNWLGNKELLALRAENEKLRSRLALENSIRDQDQYSADTALPENLFDNPFEPPPQVWHSASASPTASTVAHSGFGSEVGTPVASGCVTPVQLASVGQAITLVPMGWFAMGDRGMIPCGLVQQARAVFEQHTAIPNWFTGQ